ncbi:MAG: hypothetical protein KBT34_10420 [Prevotella sp.]|nr:hypothetical protein [Candidatus Prevotella equi]
MARERTKSRGEIYNQYFRVLGQLTTRDPGLHTTTMRQRSDRILNALNRYSDNISKTQQHKNAVERYAQDVRNNRGSWDDVQNQRYTRSQYMGTSAQAAGGAG